MNSVNSVATRLYDERLASSRAGFKATTIAKVDDCYNDEKFDEGKS
jgi:hypothetical protein